MSEVFGHSRLPLPRVLPFTTRTPCEEEAVTHSMARNDGRTQALGLREWTEDFLSLLDLNNSKPLHAVSVYQPCVIPV